MHVHDVAQDLNFLRHVLPCTPSQQKKVKAHASMHNKFAEQPNSLINSDYVHFITAYRPIAFVMYVSFDVTAPSLNRDTRQKIQTFFKK
jgi:hypothetical protein